MNSSVQASDVPLGTNDAILLINTIFTLVTPLLLLSLKLIKRCQCGRDNYIETRTESGSGTTSPTAPTALNRIASIFRGSPIQTNGNTVVASSSL